MWTKIFKGLGIYDTDYHKKYREYIHAERYEKYISLVIADIKEDFKTKIIFKTN